MEPTRDEIRAQLDRILGSDAFVNSDRLSRFLRYVVERTLAGDGDRLKEYVIGTEVFERGEQVRPARGLDSESRGRTPAGQARGVLQRKWHQRPDRDSDAARRLCARVRKRLPSTAMTRRNRLRIAGASAALLLVALAAWGVAAWGERFRAAPESAAPAVTIAVLPFANYSTGEAEALLAARVTDGVTSELARLGTLGVVSRTSALQFAGVRRSLREVARALNADVVMEGTVERDAGGVRVVARLVDASSDRKFWAEEFTGEPASLPELQRRIAAAAGAAAAKARDR